MNQPEQMSLPREVDGKGEQEMVASQEEKMTSQSCCRVWCGNLLRWWRRGVPPTWLVIVGCVIVQVSYVFLHILSLVVTTITLCLAGLVGVYRTS